MDKSKSPTPDEKDTPTQPESVSSPTEAAHAPAAPTEAAPVEADPVEKAPAQSAKAESAKAESAKAEPIKTESDKAESTKTESNKAEPTKTESDKAESTKTESNKAESTKVESNKAESTKTESNKAKPTKTESDKAKPTKTESDKADSTKSEPAVDPHSFIPKLLTVTPSPHVRTADTSRSIMLDVCIALTPALIWGIYVFGLRALTVTLVSVIFAVGAEFLYEKLMKKPITVLDFSAVVTGILLGLNLPVSVPLWMPAIGAVFAIIVVKQLFGGLGKNFVNPALAARVFLFAWPAHMSNFTSVGAKLSPFAISVGTADAVAGATPLASLKAGALSDIPLFDMIIGYEAGCIGEVSALLLTAGFIYLLYRKVITWHIPAAYIGTVLAMTFFFAKNSLTFDFSLAEIFSGGLFLGAIFMATDYSTSPVTNMGRVIYGIGCGLLTVFIRYFGGYAEGVSFSIPIMNLLVWYIDRYTKPVRFGGAGIEQPRKQA